MPSSTPSDRRRRSLARAGSSSTEAGRRVVVVPTVVAAALEEHLETYTAPDAYAWVFTGAEGGPLRRARLSEAWRAALRASGAPAGLRLHHLRHHALTLSARMPGITTRELVARAGHASPRGALIHQHATAERDRAIADHPDAVIASTPRTPRAAVVGFETSRGLAGGWTARLLVAAELRVPSDLAGTP